MRARVTMNVSHTITDSFWIFPHCNSLCNFRKESKKWREKSEIPWWSTLHDLRVRICKNSLELSRPNVNNEVHEHAPQILVQG